MSFGFGVGDFLAVAKLANDIRKRIVDAPEDIKVLDVEVRALSIMLNDVEVWLHSASVEQKNSASVILKQCLTLLQQLQQHLDSFTVLQESQSGSSRQRLQDKIKKLYTSVKWDSEDVRSFQLRIVSNITKLNNIGQRRIQVDIDGLVAHKDYQQRSELLEWISPHDYAAKQRDVLRKRVDPSASQWLLESKQFSTWLEGPGKTLFCPGIPGAGKTMTTAIVADHLLSNQESHSLTAFLYCSYESKEQQSHDQLFASILRSLVQQLPSIPGYIQQMFETQWKMGIPLISQQIFSAIECISTSVDRTNVLIDALDELPKQARNQIIETMSSLQAETGPSLFLTSRHNAEIKEKVHPDPALTIEVRAAPEDVQKYLQASLFRLPRCVLGKDMIQELIVRSITAVVDGMFLLAELHLNSLVNKTSVKEIRTALSKLSSGSDAYTAAYKEAWDRINTQPEEHKNLATQTIAILVTARRPLSVNELCHALSVDIENSQVDDKEDLRDIEDILATCAGLVTTDNDSNTVRLFHKSTQDYFHRNREDFFPFAEHMIGNICAIYRRVKGSYRVRPFYDYADKNCWSHLAQATKPQELADSDLNREAQLTQRLARSKLAEELSIQLGIEMFSSDPALNETMLRACEAGNQSLLECLLDITHFDVSKNSRLLLMAVMREDEGIMKALLSRGADPNVRDSLNIPIIFKAINGDSSAIVQMILDFKGDVECRLPFGNSATPLLWAVCERKLSCLKLLLKVSNIAATDNVGRGILSAAVAFQKIEVVKLLLDCPEVDVLQCDEEGRSALWWAVRHSNHNMITTLLGNPQIKDSVRDGVNEKILHEAVELGISALDTVRFLLGCDVVIQNCCRVMDGWSPLHHAVIRNNHLATCDPRYLVRYLGLKCWKMLQLLLESGLFDVNAADKDGMTALHHVCTFSTRKRLYPETFELYLPPRHIVAVMSNMLQSLCSAPGINLDAVDYRGETAMQKALKAGNIVHLEILVDKGASAIVKGVEQTLGEEQMCLEHTEKFIYPKSLKPSKRPRETVKANECTRRGRSVQTV